MIFPCKTDPASSMRNRGSGPGRSDLSLSLEKVRVSPSVSISMSGVLADRAGELPADRPALPGRRDLQRRVPCWRPGTPGRLHHPRREEISDSRADRGRTAITSRVTAVAASPRQARHSRRSQHLVAAVPGLRRHLAAAHRRPAADQKHQRGHPQVLRTSRVALARPDPARARPVVHRPFPRRRTCRR